MENPLDHLTEEHHFEIREKAQAELIQDFYGADDPKKISNEQAYSWLKQNASIFDAAFSRVVEEYPSFWNDAEKDFGAAMTLVKQKFIEAEKEHSE